MNHFKFFIQLIVVSFILTTIFACRSVTKHKETAKEEIAVKKHEVKDSTASVEVNKEQIKVIKEVSNSSQQSSNLTIDYTPTFDNKGELIPFSYNKEDNGKITKINIIGTGRVIESFTTEELSKEIDFSESNKIKIDSLVNVITALEKDVKETKKSVTTTKDVKPDYLKYLMWIGIGIVLLSAIIFGIKLYLKSIKKSINPFT